MHGDRHAVLVGGDGAADGDGRRERRLHVHVLRGVGAPSARARVGVRHGALAIDGAAEALLVECPSR